MFDPEVWGTVADWTAGMATLATVILGVVTVVHANRQHHAQMLAKQDEARLLMQQRQLDQAELARTVAGRIYSWLTLETEFEGARVSRVWLEVNNQTEIPCYNWTITVEGTLIRLAAVTLGPLLPGIRRWDIINHLPPGLAPGWLKSQVPAVEIEFDAHNGERLKRDGAGRLIVCS